MINSVENVAGVASTDKCVQRNNEAVKRVTDRFLSQLAKGKGEEEALNEAIKAIDENYNPKEDCLLKSVDTPKMLCAASVSPQTAKQWTEVFVMLVPTLLLIFDKFKKTEQENKSVV